MMVSVAELQGIVADGFFNGDLTAAGLIMYAMMLAVIFAVLSRFSMTAALISTIPVTLIASLMSMISTDMMILILIVAILGLAMYSKVSVSWDPLDGRDRWGRRIRR